MDQELVRGEPQVLYEAYLSISLRAVTAAGLLAIGHTTGVERTANNFVADTGQIFNSPPAH